MASPTDADDPDAELRPKPSEISRRRISVVQGEHDGKAIAVFTSGGDSQGMNAAVRAVVRFGLYIGCNVYFIKEGYQGMVDGGSNIVEADWKSVSGIIHQGGTVIGSARCKAFREREGRLRAAKNLLEKDISNLVVIGGDGSLTGANMFKQEWPDLMKELLMRNEIGKEVFDKHKRLHIVGMVGSIDNDFCGTDMTIGTDSALHRIVEAVDAITPTAFSHQRTFILEVMGRHCGYLALVGGIATEADYVFIPENPPPEDWQKRLCRKLATGREMGKRLNIIIVAEGAIDRQGNAITCQQVKDVIVSNLKQDTRITVLGHVQRGGAPSAFDRILGCRMGAEAVLALMEATLTPEDQESEAYVVSIKGNAAIRIPLMANVKQTQAVAQAMKDGDWGNAVQLRGMTFQRNLDVYVKLSKQAYKEREPGKELPLGVLCVGAPSCGMNAAVRGFVRACILDGNKPFGISNGIEGLIAGNVQEMKWQEVTGWSVQGGALLGTKRTLPEANYDKVADSIKRFNLKALFFIGGFEAYHAVLQLAENRSKYPEFCIPMIILPATISNNVPGTDFSLGADTALNEIAQMCDQIRQSAQGTKRRVFVIEVMGGYCGYLATMAGLAGGADAVYIHEEKITIKDLIQDLEIMKRKMDSGKIERGLIIRNEKANDNYTTDFVFRLFTEEGKGIFSCRKNVLGHIQQGGYPSPFDRNTATKMSFKAYQWIREQLEEHMKPDGYIRTTDPNSAVLFGLRSKHSMFQSVEELKEETDFVHRRWTKSWWLGTQRSIMKILSKHESTYTPGEKYVSIKGYQGPQLSED